MLGDLQVLQQEKPDLGFRHRVPDQRVHFAAATNLVQSVIDQAKRQVCQILDDQLRDTIGSINRQMNSFQSSINGDLFRQLNGSISPISPSPSAAVC